MPRSITRVIVLFAAMATVGLLQATPASADLPLRCGAGKALANGVTVQACVSADLSYVHGTVNVLVNAAGLPLFAADDTVTVFSYVVYGPAVSGPHEFTGPHKCVLHVTRAGTYACPAYAAPNLANTVYNVDGYANHLDLYSGYAESPWINP